MNATAMPFTGLHCLVEGSFGTVYEGVRTALKAAGFEIVAEIDMAKLLEKQSPSYIRPFKAIVVFDSDIAQRVLTVAPTVMTLIPCQVSVFQTEDGQIEIKMTDPRMAWNTSYSPYLEPIVGEVMARLERVMDALKK